MASDGDRADNFGGSVSLSGDVAIVGAPGYDSHRGYANIYVLDEEAAPPPASTCGGLYEAAKKFAVGWSDDNCTVEPDECFWTLCQVSPELWLVTQKPCLSCDLVLSVPEDLKLDLGFTLPYLADDLSLFKEKVELGLYTLKGKPISHGELDYVVVEGKEGYGLRLKEDLPAGDYQLRISILDEALAEELVGSPFAFAFGSGK